MEKIYKSSQYEEPCLEVDEPVNHIEIEFDEGAGALYLVINGECIFRSLNTPGIIFKKYNSKDWTLQ